MFNRDAEMPYDLRIPDFEIAIQDVYDFFRDVNDLLMGKGLPRLDDMLRPAAMSGILSDMLTASLANHSRSSSRTSISTAIPTSSCAANTPTMP